MALNVANEKLATHTILRDLLVTWDFSVMQGNTLPRVEDSPWIEYNPWRPRYQKLTPSLPNFFFSLEAKTCVCESGVYLETLVITHNVKP